MRLRARDAGQHNERYVSLMDSQVNLGHMAKGRSSSLRMSHVERQIAGTTLAAHLREIGAYTRSEANPADEGSRDRAGWAKQRRELRSGQSKAASGALRRQTP